ncbi:MAG: hypothetical protein KAU27_14825 [Desulfuromonadales bacterium]|nr:hypothetical protein [Desulfuromonadales bacterium]
MRFIIFIVLISFLLVNTTLAAEHGKIKIQSRSFINASTCGQVVAGLDKQENRRQLALMVGSFVSGTNYARNRNSMMPLKNMLIVTEKFCRKNPKKSIMVSLINLDRVIDKQIELMAQKQ